MNAALVSHARSYILGLPPAPSVIRSNPPMYHLFWRTVRTSPARLEAGMTMHSFFCLLSEVLKRPKRVRSTFLSGLRTDPSSSYFFHSSFPATSLQHCPHSQKSH